VSFGSPWMLLLLLAVPALVVAYVLRERNRDRFAARWTTPALLPNLVDRAPGRLRHLPAAILLVALAALIVGVARPHATVSVPREEATVLLAMDTSRSMGANDITPTRLVAAQVAPTDDRQLVQRALGTLKPGEGTAIGDAVVLAARLGLRQKDKDGHAPPTSVLLISDGAPDGGRTRPPAAAQRARSLHVPVYTISLGTPGGTVEHRLPGGYVETIRVPPSPETLQMIARTTGGQFFTAATDEQLKSVYAGLGSRLGHTRKSREITDMVAAGGGALLIVGILLSVFWFRRVA
jgi:Ca-activated chloride channel family protein